MERVSRIYCSGGWQEVWSHDSESCSCPMRFGIYLPAQATMAPVPVVYWLSGLTCTEDNFVTKAGAQRYASKHGVAIVAPDTSPRGEGVADADQYDLGQGAGFYVNASQSPWQPHYRMYDYVTAELPELVESRFPVTGQRSIMGHSMGGHGALVVALRNVDRYQSVSAFAPICAPTRVPWGKQALGAYLGDDETRWADYDACELVSKAARKLPMRVDQGLADNFLEEQLRPELLEAACSAADYPLDLWRHENYDHSYFFIATFIGEHIAFHAKAINNSS